METLAGAVEFALWPLSLAALAVLVLLGRPRARWPRRGVVALVLLMALTLAQPVGVRARSLGVAPPVISGPAATDGTLELLGLPIVRFSVAQRPIDRLGLGECCPPQDALRVRSSVALPGLLTNAATVTELNGDGAPSNWRLRGEDGLFVVTADAYAASAPDPGWQLEAGVTSSGGVIYWALAAAGLVALVVRRRRA